MAREEDWEGTRCLGGEKVDLLGTAKETASPRSQIPRLQRCRSMGARKSGDLGRDGKESRQAREGTAVHPTASQAHTRTHARTHIPHSSQTQSFLRHVVPDSVSQQDHMNQGSCPEQKYPFLSETPIPHQANKKNLQLLRLSRRTNTIAVALVTPLFPGPSGCHLGPGHCSHLLFLLPSLLNYINLPKAHL